MKLAAAARACVVVLLVASAACAAPTALSRGAGHEAAARREAERVAAVQQLQDTIHLLPAAEAARRFAALERRALPPPRQEKIDHFVVLFVENQAFLRMRGSGPRLWGLVAAVLRMKRENGIFIKYGRVRCFTTLAPRSICAHIPHANVGRSPPGISLQTTIPGSFGYALLSMSIQPCKWGLRPRESIHVGGESCKILLNSAGRIVPLSFEIKWP